jgi:hypothetical protein
MKIGSGLPCLAWMSRARVWTCWTVISGLMNMPSGVQPVIPKSFSGFSFRSLTMSMKILGFWQSDLSVTLSVTETGLSVTDLSVTSDFELSVTSNPLAFFTRQIAEQNFASARPSNSFPQVVQISLVIFGSPFG